MTLVNLYVCASGVRPPAAMDLDTSLETTPPTGGIVAALQTTPETTIKTYSYSLYVLF